MESLIDVKRHLYYVQNMMSGLVVSSKQATVSQNISGRPNNQVASNLHANTPSNPVGMANDDGLHVDMPVSGSIQHSNLTSAIPAIGKQPTFAQTTRKQPVIESR